MTSVGKIKLKTPVVKYHVLLDVYGDVKYVRCFSEAEAYMVQLWAKAGGINAHVATGDAPKGDNYPEAIRAAAEHIRNNKIRVVSVSQPIKRTYDLAATARKILMDRNEKHRGELMQEKLRRA